MQLFTRIHQNSPIPLFINSSTCIERHTAHHQELKNCNCSPWPYTRPWPPVADSDQRPRTCVRPGAAVTVFELLMMGGVSLDACWAINKQWNWWILVNSCIMLVISIQFILRRQFLSSWWWAVCRSKHVELLINNGIGEFWWTVASCWLFIYDSSINTFVSRPVCLTSSLSHVQFVSRPVCLTSSLRTFSPNLVHMTGSLRVTMLKCFRVTIVAVEEQ